MSDRQRQRRGRASSVAGAPAEEALGDLVRQFSDVYAFVRELIQNSLDASASRIDVDMRWDAAKGCLTVAVTDDGEGMDREIIEGYLLVLFRSTKEEDRTRIGKFGIGFVSLFALNPREVVVDTGRDQIWHQVVFDTNRHYTLLRQPDPFEGTRVTLYLDRSRAQALKDAQEIRASALRWCRYAEAGIYTSCDGFGEEDWPSTSIAQPFTLECPVVVEERADGFHALVGVSATPQVGFYNHGLTLWEQPSELLPGVSFRVKGRHLEHTLTRDNVRRGPAFEEVMRRLQALIQTRLAPALHKALAEAAEDPARRQALWSALAPRLAWDWDEQAPIVPRVGGAPVSLATLRAQLPGRLSRWMGRTEHGLLWGGAQDPLALAVAASGRLILASEGALAPHLLRIAALAGAEPQHVSTQFVLWTLAEPPEPWGALSVATEALAKRSGYAHRLHLASLHGYMGFAQVKTGKAGEVRPLGEQGALRPTAELLIRVDHPLLEELLALPPDLAAPLLLRAARRACGDQSPLPPDLLQAAVAALPRESP